MKEFYIPPKEGPCPSKPLQLRIFEQDELPLEIGNLEREAMSMVSDWMTVTYSDGYGLIYRFCTKEGVRDNSGDAITLILHFAFPFARKGLKITPEIASQQYERLAEYITTFTMKLTQTYETHVISCNPKIPQWMIDEAKKWGE